MATLVNTSDPEVNIMVRMNRPEAGVSAVGDDFSKNALSIWFKGAKLDNQSFTSNIGDNKTVSMSWSTQVGSSTDTVHNVLLYTGNSAANTAFGV